MHQLIRAALIGILGAVIIWILSGSSASIGFGVLLFYLESKEKSSDAESRTFGAQKKKTFWHS